MSDAPAARILVIGIGNTLRRDDGVGRLIADEVARWSCPEVQAIGVHQLTPELALPMSDSEMVIFVDACRSGDRTGVDVRILVPPEQGEMSVIHALSPRLLLGLTRCAYDRCPVAFLVTAPAEDFGFGEALSAVAELGLSSALRQIKTMVERGPYPEPFGAEWCHDLVAPHPPPRSPGPQP